LYFRPKRRDGRVAEGARLESVYRGNSIEGSNPSLSASSQRTTYTISEFLHGLTARNSRPSHHGQCQEEPGVRGRAPKGNYRRKTKLMDQEIQARSSHALVRAFEIAASIT
jgi:hypothetical protein